MICWREGSNSIVKKAMEEEKEDKTNYMNFKGSELEEEYLKILL